MRLTRLRMEALRNFREPMEIGGFQDGVNLFVGPNGAGKSTIVRAICAAFFERYGSGSVTDLLPWGEPAAAPSIELDFVCGGHVYHLRKRFLARRRCSLDIDGKAFENSEAEGQLAELLGFQYAGKGASKPEHWGVPGLLWIQQGKGGDGHGLYDAVSHATGHLRKALEDSLGEVASTAGDDVFERVQAEREKLLTRTGQATGEWKEAGRLLADASQKVEALAAQLATYRGQVDRFGRLNEQILEGNRQQPWKHSQAQAKAAGDQLALIDKAREALAADRQILGQTQAQLCLLEQHQTTFSEQAARLSQRREAAVNAASLLAEAELALSFRREQLAAAQLAHDQAQVTLATAEQQERRRHQVERLAGLQERHAAFEARMVLGQKMVVRLNRQRQEIASRRISDDQLETLRRNEREIQTAGIRLEAAATRLSYRLDAGKTIQRDGVSLKGTGTTQLVDRTVLTIAQVGSLTIEPGGGQDLVKLSELRAGLERAQARLLQALGLNSLGAAEQRLQQRKAAEQGAQVEQARLDQLAPKGLDAVAAERAGVAAELADVQGSIGARFTAGPGVCAADASSAQAATAARLQTAQAAEQDARAAWGAAKGALTHADDEWSALRSALEAGEYQQRVAQNLAETEAAGQRLALLAVKVMVTEQGIEAAQPQVLQQDVDRFTRSAFQALQAQNQRREELIGLQSQLDAAGANGLEEDLASAQGALDRLQRRHHELQRRAKALDLLSAMLQAKRQALTRRLQAPLLKHLSHYLQLLMPGASVTVDEALKPVALSLPASAATAQGEGGFHDLSFGTREQISLISRLAYADLLKEANRPTLIILDDGLVNTDAVRLSQMKRILYDAAGRHQILLFSCHPERWADLGAVARDVSSLRNAQRQERSNGLVPTTGD